VKIVSKGNVTGRKVAKISPVEPHITILVYAIKIEPNQLSLISAWDSKGLAIPALVEAEVAVSTITIRVRRSLYDKVVRCIDCAPGRIVVTRRARLCAISAGRLGHWRPRRSRRRSASERNPICI
jgi:hypothetical protein